MVMAVTLLGWVEAILGRASKGRPVICEGKPPLLCWLGVPLAQWLTSGLKLVFGRPRPFEQYHSLGLDPAQLGSAFPSGHATAAFALATALACRWPKGWLAWFAAAGLVAISRVALGLHWPSDVAAGAAVGSLVVFGLARLEENLNKRT
ncbi:MAG: phosphatase PAP2 family protein [Candidatus Omnitrophica bacterium]|nr:phosphatase PAP2 family protein [Candidatus Omnitrophota bacterium]